MLLVAAYLPLALLMAHSQRLLCDEIYTYRIAQQPTWGGMLRLSRTLDLHPPLHYILQRLALGTGLPRWLASRLPSLIAGQLTLLAIFSLVAGLSSNVQGLFAAAIYSFTPAINFSWCNRPYALWFFLLSLTALLWCRAASDRRRSWIPTALGIAALAMVMDHIFGLVCLSPFYLAEGLRAYRRKRLDWPVAAALVLPSLAGLAYLHQVTSLATHTVAPLLLPSVDKAIDLYTGLVSLALTVLTACAVAAILLIPEERTSRYLRVPLTNVQAVMMAGLFAVPAFIMILATIHPTQWFLRYGACGTVGFALLVPFAMMRARRTQAIAVLMTVAMLVTSTVRANTDTFDVFGPWRAFTIPGVPPQRLEALDPSLPIAMASAPRFVELNDEVPAVIARRLAYVTDRTEAQRYSAQTLFETEDQAIGPLGLLGKVEPREAFFAEHTRFYMIANYPDPEEWLMRYLMANGASVRYMGKFVSTISSDDLYLVTLPGK